MSNYRISIAFFLALMSAMVGCTKSGEENEVSQTESSQQVIQSQSDAQPTQQPPANREARIAQADQRMESGQLEEAAAILKEQLLVDPDDVEVLFRLANLSAAKGELGEAIKFLDSIPPDNFEAGLPALGQSADWCVQLERYADAERRYRTILQMAPDAAIAHRRLGQLLNRQGRRHEAAEHIRELCKLGDIRQDELHALVVLSDAIASDSDDTGGDVDYRPIGAAGQARLLFTERKYAEAAEVLRDTVKGKDTPPAVLAFYGRAVAEAQDDEAFISWLSSLTDIDAVSQFSEYWSAIGTYLAREQQSEPAARALLEALDRDPTDFRSMNRLHQMLTQLEEPDKAERWEFRWNANRKVLLANNEISASATPNLEAMDEIASQLSGLGRNLEAVLWKSLESYHRKLPIEVLEQWNRERQKLVAAGTSFPDQSQRICNMTLADYRPPDVSSLRTAAVVRNNDRARVVAEAGAAQFRNVTGEIGLSHEYLLASEPIESGFAMYHQAGGGVAVLDYDRDGKPDLYFAQGGADPPKFVSQHSNSLFRNVGGRVIDVTTEATAEDRQYTIGCSAGDWNQDGFPDLITGNIGPNQLLINNGDGTFTPRALPGSEDLQRMPASVAIADLNGDALPDIFEVNYIQDSEIAMLPERDASGGVVEAVGPADFAPARDRIGINDGKGGVDFVDVGDPASSIYRGLGVVIADFNNDLVNDVFVGNDKSPNQLWVRSPETQAWMDLAMVSGVAYSFDGGGTASMGIAAGDFDHSGTLDLHVTNFQNESACLYLSRGSAFQDRAVQFRLGVPSYQVLGFGSQSLDYDNNGLLDLAVTNGHIDNYSTMSGPFRQKSQLFANLGNRFEEIDVVDPSGYWSEPHLGRAMAKLDFNRDGKTDLVVTHLNEPSVLLLNEADSSGHWLQLELVGVKSERDAIGAKVTVESGEQQWTEWLIGGDGYLCRNESVVSFGLGAVTQIDRVEVQWPSGATQTLDNVGVDRRIVVVEEETDAFEIVR